METEYEVLVGGEWLPLVRAVGPDACDDCKAGVYVGYDHPECETLVPATARREGMMEAKVRSILDSLAAAYGGHSQYGTSDIGRALAGQVNNNGWAEGPQALGRCAAALLAERWDGQGNSEEEDAYEIERACVMALAGLGVARQRTGASRY